MTIQIRRAGESDLEELRRISIQTFQETFAGQNTEEDMKRYIAGAMSLDALRSELQTPASVFLLASVGETIAGYAKINFWEAQTEKDCPDSLELQRIYIARAFKGQHVGSRLMAEAIAMGRAAGLSWLWLGVWERNEAAIAFYRAKGFERFGAHVFQLGTDRQTDWLMRLSLRQD